MEEKHYIEAPIMIPSLKRYMKQSKKSKKEPRMMIDSCLEDIFKYYDAPNVKVLAQEYEEQDQILLQEKYPQVEFKWKEKRMGIINTFNALKDWGTSLHDFYIHYDDDVKMTAAYKDNPTLLALAHVMESNIDRVGAVTVPSMSIIHFSLGYRGEEVPKPGNLIRVHANPAQLVAINSTPARECTYDSRFENFRSDTDFTMQLASKGYIPVMITRYFTFLHSVPLAKIEIGEDGKRKFQTLDNVTETKGSIGGDRRMENKIREWDQFAEKWPGITTTKGYKSQILKPTVVKYTKATDRELVEMSDNFDLDIIKNFYPDVFLECTPEYQAHIGKGKKDKLF